MLKVRLAATAGMLLATTLALAGPVGTFRGHVVQSRRQASATMDEAPCVYVQGRNLLLRKVLISKAEVVYGPGVPPQAQPASQLLIEGAEVRVTAEQDGKGEWQARRIEILHLPPEDPQSAIPRQRI